MLNLALLIIVAWWLTGFVAINIAWWLNSYEPEYTLKTLWDHFIIGFGGPVILTIAVIDTVLSRIPPARKVVLFRRKQ